MKKSNQIFNYSLIVYSLLVIASCSKPNPDYLNGNNSTTSGGNSASEFTATISMSGRPDVVIGASGMGAHFTRTISNGDTIISIVGTEPQQELELILGNIRVEGNYDFVASPLPGSRLFSICTYSIGADYVYTSKFSNEINSNGRITITKLTSTYISGSIDFTSCTGVGSTTGEAQIKSVTFKGDL